MKLQRNGPVFKSFQYALLKQQFLELIEAKEHQKAFGLLTKRLKPLESYQSTPTEFRDLCYLLTARSFHEVGPSASNAGGFSGSGNIPGVREIWEGVTQSREKLVQQFERMLDFDGRGDTDTGKINPPPDISDHRLLTLLRQAVAYQVEFSPYHPKSSPRVTSLLKDYTSFVIPNAQQNVFEGHMNNVKCVAFVGEDGNWILSGGGDNTVRIWETDTATPVGILEGHTSRVWDVTASADGSVGASGSGEGIIK
ncbi:hypothetical protein HDU93_005985, partial [Gonapodya sp. JEL0774]